MVLILSLKIKIYLLLTLSIVIFSPLVSSYDCSPPADVYLNFVSYSKLWSELSDYTFPSQLREEDYLFLDYVGVVNKANCTLSPSQIILSVVPSNGYSPPDKHTGNYNDYSIEIPSLNESGIYELIYRGPSKIEERINGKITKENMWIHWPLRLDELGDWIIKANFEGRLINGTKSYPSYIIYVNNEYGLRRFRVYSKFDLENRNISQKSYDVAFWAL